ncbi:hypothetical protein AMATHDRAFT_75507 [Amanita thiersii Skay4041]|uniref:Hydrophobin n=1 Tax=Amanita thiersii Skay4041 TaxID=703135 RepID=A0A2A9NSH9_9AGAR|nr:hypothetical protein AMATHDRAFT_75507 [Amanita thiersii Skay4041]
MFARVSALVLVVPLLVSASAIPRTGPSISQCNVGSVQCCNSVQSASHPSVTSLAGLLGLDLGDITGLVGLTCNPISVLGIGGNSCSAQPVCCSNNSFNGLISLGCTPININL